MGRGQGIPRRRNGTRTKPVVAKYTGVLGSADVEESTYSTVFMIMQSMRLDLGAGSQVHP